MKYPFDIMEHLPDNLRVTADVEVVNKIQSNWWDKMVRDSAHCTTKEGYENYRVSCDTALAETLVTAGNAFEVHFTKSGRIKIGSLFSTKEGYNSYRSAKSIIGGALDMGVSLVDDVTGQPRPKSQVQADIKAKTTKESMTAFDKASMYADRIVNMQDSLTDAEKESLYKKLSVLEPIPF